MKIPSEQRPPLTPRYWPGWLGVGHGIHRKARGKHFRQHDHIGSPCLFLDDGLQVMAVIRRVFPCEFSLYQGDAQILHRTSAARSSNSSLFAKQNLK